MSAPSIPIIVLITLHSATGGSFRPMLEDDTLLDFDMLQTGHSSY